MFKQVYAAAAATLIWVSSTGIGWAQNGMVGQGFTNALDSTQAISVRLPPTFQFENAEHVANGVALRNRSAGTIHLRGVPERRRVMRALLYWNFSDGLDKGRDRAAILFDGNRVNGAKVADNADPCWGMTGNHTYRANVTRFVPVVDPNQDYRVVTLFDTNTSTTGQNPWGPPEVQNVRMEGAWLIVVYRSEPVAGMPAQNLAIYDNLSGTTMLGTDLNAFFSHPTIGAGSGLFTMCGADGQRDSTGYSNSPGAELTFFNGVQIAGPYDPAAPPVPLPASASDWDGSDGWPLVQLADTHTHRVDFQTFSSVLRYQVGPDCLTPVAFVIQGNP